MNKTINYQFFHWGPFLYKTKLNDDEINKIKKLCKKDKKKDYRKDLAGLIRNEYEIDKKKLFPIIAPYIESYLKAANEYYGFSPGKSISLESSWVNYMTKFESNPLHIHNADISFVIYTKIPENLKKEFAKNLANQSPGSINFIHSLSNLKYNISQHNFFPNVGDLFIFPANLYHCVNHFKSEGERISISGNLEISNV